MTRRIWMSLVAGAALSLSPWRAHAQLTCEVNNQTNCIIGGTATSAINITVTSAARLSLSSSSVTIPTPTDASYTAGFGSPGSVQFEVRSNANWVVSISTSATTWTGSPLSARQDKPQTDLQWALAPAGPFTDVTGTQVSLSSGSATNSSIQTLYLRSKYDWVTDRPGSYTISLQVTLTAP